MQTLNPSSTDSTHGSTSSKTASCPDPGPKAWSKANERRPSRVPGCATSTSVGVGIVTTAAPSPAAVGRTRHITRIEPLSSCSWFWSSRRRLRSACQLPTASSRAGSTARAAPSIASRRYRSARSSMLQPLPSSSSSASSSPSAAAAAGSSPLWPAPSASAASPPPPAPAPAASSERTALDATSNAASTCFCTLRGLGGTGLARISASSAARLAVSCRTRSSHWSATACARASCPLSRRSCARASSSSPCSRPRVASLWASAAAVPSASSCSSCSCASRPLIFCVSSVTRSQ
mmetsp:Transcript_41470/g.133347  ORF Transcript_41470/g.133347 Transcript_41470/m.133347 type:complete len:292 (-) Transcript_41470:97-972(-)